MLVGIGTAVGIEVGGGVARGVGVEVGGGVGVGKAVDVGGRVVGGLAVGVAAPQARTKTIPVTRKNFNIVPPSLEVCGTFRPG